jgi:hypothetical protein
MNDIIAILRKLWAVAVLLVAAVAMWNAGQNFRTEFGI